MTRELQIVLDRHIARRRGRVRRTFLVGSIRATSLRTRVPEPLAPRSRSMPGDGDARPAPTGVHSAA